MSPSRLFVDRERALVIASVDVTIGSHIFSQIERIAQFRLVNDLNLPALSCYYRDHFRIISAYLALPGSSTLLAASMIKMEPMFYSYITITIRKGLSWHLSGHYTQSLPVRNAP